MSDKEAKDYDSGYAAGVQSQETKALRCDVDAMHGRHKQLVDKIDKLIPSVARLEVKASVWGGVGGVLAALVTVAISIATKIH